ncbi:MAG: hypothetical protein KJZ54_13445 [Phycisphaerales bacterium]|nr:hypothetical protein [Phycisphaerales bacterium]
MPTFSVQALNTTTGQEAVVKVVAQDEREAIDHIHRLGLASGKVSLVAVESGPSAFNEDDVAFYVALGGFVMFPLGIVGWVWGKTLHEQSGGAKGARAWRTGKLAVGLWIVFAAASVLLGVVASGAFAYVATMIDPSEDRIDTTTIDRLLADPTRGTGYGEHFEGAFSPFMSSDRTTPQSTTDSKWTTPWPAGAGPGGLVLTPSRKRLEELAQASPRVAALLEQADERGVFPLPSRPDFVRAARSDPVMWLLLRDIERLNGWE